MNIFIFLLQVKSTCKHFLFFFYNANLRVNIFIFLAQGKYRIEFDIGIHMRKKIIDKEGELEFSLQRIKGVGQRFITPAIRGRNSLFRPNSFLNDLD